MLTRYLLEPMADIWGVGEEGALRTKYVLWLAVEEAIIGARVARGTLRAADAKAMLDAMTVDPSRIAVLEAETQHDFASFVGHHEEQLDAAGLGDLKRYLHKPFGSYDVEDTAIMMQLRRSFVSILTAAQTLERALQRKAEEHRTTLMIARTHGQAALPTTFGQLLLVYATEMRRNVRRLQRVIEDECQEAKLAGDVGNFVGVDPALAQKALEALFFRQAEAETQILQRDRHASMLGTLAVVASSIAKFCETFWLMMHANARELEEPFARGQKGSVAMPHKKNPIVTERLIGMAREVRHCAALASENSVVREHRDISQSNVERRIFADATATTFYSLEKFRWIVENMTVRPEEMLRHIAETHETWAGQRLREALIEKGVDDELAYRYVQCLSFEAVAQRRPLSAFAEEYDVTIEGFADFNAPSVGRTAKDILGDERFAQAFDLASYVMPGIDHLFCRFATTDVTVLSVP